MTVDVSGSSPPDPAFTPGRRLAGAIVGLAVGTTLLAGGLWVVVLMTRIWFAEARVYGWSETTATIVDEHVWAPARPNQDPSLSVRFRYDYGGHSYESNRVSAAPSARYRDAYRLAGRWQPGSTWACYVDPQHPEGAVLLRDDLWWGLAVLLPLAIAGGLGGLFLYAGWISLRPTREPRPPAHHVAKALVRRIGTALLIISLAVTTYVLGIEPLVIFARARGWRACPCRIVASRVRASSRGIRTGYGPAIAYRYEDHGRVYVSGDYQLMSNDNGTARDAAEIVNRYQPGATSVCYVDRRDPSRAVLDRSLPDTARFGVLPFGALIVAAWRLIVSRRRREPPAAA